MPEQLAYDQLIQRVAAWANSATDVHMVLLIGSRARTDCPHDEWSDADLVMVVDNPKDYLYQTDWLRSIRRPLVTFLEPTAVGGFVERRVLFNGGLDVDFAIIPKVVFEFEWPPEVESVFRRGVKVLVDKVGLSKHLPAAPSDPPKALPPQCEELLEKVNEFFYQFVWCSKKLCRGELWAAKMCCDSHLKWLLLRMTEWHSQFAGNMPRDTWHNGRFFDTWVDKDVLEELRTSFATYDTDCVWHALFATKDLYKRLAQEVASALGYELPMPEIEAVEDLVVSYARGAERSASGQVSDPFDR